jgi:hypothetical protein
MSRFGRMKTLFVLPLVLVSLLSFPSWGLSIDDLVYRKGLYYKKFTDVPFTGEIEGRISGSFIDGKFDGLFVHYWENGQLQTKGVYKDGKKEGKWVYFFMDGAVFEALTGTYINGVKVGD